MKDGRQAPFCYQTLDAVEAIRGHFTGQQRAMALAIYQTLTVVVNEQRHAGGQVSAEITRADLAVLAGVSVRSLDTCTKEFRELGLLHLESRKRGTTSLPSVWTLTERDEAASGAASKPERSADTPLSSSAQAAPDARVQEVQPPGAGGAAPNAGATGEPEEELQEEPSISPFTEDFRGWLSHHWATTSIDPPAENSKVWRDTLWAYTRARESGFAASQLQMAIEGAWNSDWYRSQGFADPLSMLADKGLGKRAEVGREHRSKATTPGAAKTGWDAWVAEHMPDLDGYLADVAAFKASWLASSRAEVTAEDVRAAIDRTYSMPDATRAA